ncbi:prepilin peptidase [Actinorhabdospora filicis]|nr:prepilin peptidase [Actinorhabdospora filicis]
MDIFAAAPPALAVGFAPLLARVVVSRTGLPCPAVPLALCSAGFAAIAAWTAAAPVVLLAALAAPLVLTDVLARRLPDPLTLPAYPAVLAGLAATGPPDAVWRAVAAAVVALAGLGSVHLLAPAALGPGDVKLAGLLALPLGAVSWAAVWAATVLVLTAGGLAAGWALARGRREVPYGPVLLVGALMTLLR